MSSVDHRNIVVLRREEISLTAPSELTTQNLRNVYESKAMEVFKKRVQTNWLE